MTNDNMSLGQQFQQAREDQQLSVADVANRLRLLKRRISEIENEDFSQSPAKAYMRGYVRSYARLLGLPELEVMQQFEALDLAEHSPKHMGFANQQDITSRHPMIRWISYGMIAVLVGLVVIWVKNHYLEIRTAPIGTINSLDNETGDLE